MPHRPKKFLLLFNARTGSNLLRSLLNSHPDIVCDEELFNDDHDFDFLQDPYRQIEACRKRNAHKRVYGYKVSVFQINQMALVGKVEDFLQHMHQNNWTIVYLNRRKTSLQALSLLKAQKTNIHHLSKDSARPNIKIRLTLGEVFKTIYSLKYSRKYELYDIKNEYLDNHKTPSEQLRELVFKERKRKKGS